MHDQKDDLEGRTAKNREELQNKLISRLKKKLKESFWLKRRAFGFLA